MTAETKAPGTYDWRIWYTLAIVGLTLVTFMDHMGPEIFFAIPLNWLLYFVPVWLVVRLVRRMRRK